MSFFFQVLYLICILVVPTLALVSAFNIQPFLIGKDENFIWFDLSCLTGVRAVWY